MEGGGGDSGAYYDWLSSYVEPVAEPQPAAAPQPAASPQPAAVPQSLSYDYINSLIKPETVNTGGYYVDATGGESGGSSYYQAPETTQTYTATVGDKIYSRDPVTGQIRESFINEPSRRFNEEAQASGYYTNVYNPDGSVNRVFNRQKGLWEETKPLVGALVGLGTLGYGLGALGGLGAAGAAGTAGELAALGELGINTALTPGTVGGLYGGATGAAELAALEQLGINTSLAPGSAGGIYGPASVGSAISGTGGIASLADVPADIGLDMAEMVTDIPSDIGLDMAEMADISSPYDIPTDLPEAPTDYYEPIDPSEFSPDIQEPGSFADPSNTLDFPEMPSDITEPINFADPSNTLDFPEMPSDMIDPKFIVADPNAINMNELADYAKDVLESENPTSGIPPGTSSTTTPGVKPPSSSSSESNWMKDLLKLLLAGGAAAAASRKPDNRAIKPVGGRGPDPRARRWDPKTQTYYSTATGERIYKAAGGGISGLPRNEYKAGGRYLAGPGDGMSDNIKANIDGVQEARLADGEFVIPADVVSHIGNGSSNAGAKKLHAMMARIRHARTGNSQQGKQIKAEKYLPV